MAETIARAPLTEEDLEELRRLHRLKREVESSISMIQSKCKHEMEGIRGGGIQTLWCKHCDWTEGPCYD